MAGTAEPKEMGLITQLSERQQNLALDLIAECSLCEMLDYYVHGLDFGTIDDRGLDRVQVNYTIRAALLAKITYITPNPRMTPKQARELVLLSLETMNFPSGITSIAELLKQYGPTIKKEYPFYDAWLHKMLAHLASFKKAQQKPA